MTDRKVTCVACKSAITEGDIAHSDLEFGGELKATNQPEYNADADTDLVATIGTLDEYTPMIRNTGNQTKSGVMTFIDPIVGRFGYHKYIASSNGAGKWVKIASFPTNMLRFSLILESRYGYTILIGSLSDMLTKTHSASLGAHSAFKMVVEKDGTYTLWYQLRVNYDTYYVRNICAERYATELLVTILTDTTWYDEPTAGQSSFDSQEMAQ